MKNKYKIGIIGKGKMGKDIFYLLEESGFQLVWICRSKEDEEEIQKKFLKKNRRMLKMSLIDEKQYNNKIDSVKFSSNLEELHDTDIIVEAITEDVQKKKDLFIKIDKIAKKECIFASNTSSIIPSKLCPDTDRKDKFVGLHFFYPVKLKNIVELIITKNTSDNTIEKIIALLQSIDKFYITLDEKNGFILNKFLLPVQAEAFKILEENMLDTNEIDELIKNELFPAGVFDFFDNVGIDVMAAAIDEYTNDYNNNNFFSPMKKKLYKFINEGRLGKKNNTGFYNYKKNENKKNSLNINDYKQEQVLKLKSLFINSFYQILEKKVCKKTELNSCIKEYLDIKDGPVELLNRSDNNKLYSILNKLYKETGNKAYMPSTFLC